MARRSVEPSTMSLLGLVRHLAEGERATFRGMMSGQDVPRLFCSDTDRDGDFDGAGRIELSRACPRQFEGHFSSEGYRPARQDHCLC